MPFTKCCIFGSEKWESELWKVVLWIIPLMVNYVLEGEKRNVNFNGNSIFLPPLEVVLNLLLNVMTSNFTDILLFYLPDEVILLAE